MKNTITPPPPSVAQIEFSQNWNKKLNCGYFTTIRIDSDKYYAGAVYDIIIKKQFAYRAQIVTIKKIYLHELDEITARCDTG